MIEKLYNEGANFTGGLVRDFLILGDGFNDVDFYFDKEPDWIQKKEGNHKRFSFVENGMDYHCQRIIPGASLQDLSCNLFSFSKDRGIFGRPTVYGIDYNLAFEMLLNKEFTLLDLRDVNIRFKMVGRGWTEKNAYYPRVKINAPLNGIWDKYSALAQERFASLT